jgi:hypothetical protein
MLYKVTMHSAAGFASCSFMTMRESDFFTSQGTIITLTPYIIHCTSGWSRIFSLYACKMNNERLTSA